MAGPGPFVRWSYPDGRVAEGQCATARYYLEHVGAELADEESEELYAEWEAGAEAEDGQAPGASEAEAPAPAIESLGGGWYRVGQEKVQGREAAEALVAEGS